MLVLSRRHPRVFSEGVVPCGQICGAVSEMKSAKQVVKEMVDEAVRVLEEEFPARIKFGG